MNEPFGQVSGVQKELASDLRAHGGWAGRVHHRYDGLSRCEQSAKEDEDPPGAEEAEEEEEEEEEENATAGNSSESFGGTTCGELAELRPIGIIRGPHRSSAPYHSLPPPAYHQLQHHLQQHQLHHPLTSQHHYRVVTFDERPLAPQLEMESVGHQVAVPLRVGGKKMRKRRELDALVAHSLAKGTKGGTGRHIASNGVASHDQLLSNSTDDQEDYSWQPKVRTQSRCRTKRFSCLRTCGPLLFVSCIFISLAFMYWLYFDIRQQISQYRIRIEQVSATSQNVPEALQKWHETSKNLEQNQTVLNGTLRQMQQLLTNFYGELKQLRETIEKKNENSQEAQLNRLQSSVADLGSNIGDSNSRIGALEARFTVIQADQKQLNKTLEDLQKLFGRIQNTTSVSDIIGGDEVAKGVEKTIAELRDQLTGQLNNLAQNVTDELEALRQKNVWLVTDLANQTKRIESLVEDKNNISSHVSSIQAVWLEVRNNISTLEADRKTINEQLAVLANVTTGLHGTIETVQEECQLYLSNLHGVNGKLGELQDQITQIVTKDTLHLPRHSSNGTQQENMPPVLSQLFAEKVPTVMVSTNSPIPSKTTMTTTPQPRATDAPTEPVASGAEGGGGSSISKKSAPNFDSVI